MNKIMESKNYDMFELLPFNRDVKKFKHLEQSFREHGWLDPYPAHVVKNGNGKLKIKSGHHRFHVAQRLGVPIKYVISNDTASVYQLEKSTNTWSMKDYLDSYCRQGYPDYLQVKSYCDQTGISLKNIVSMMAGQSAGSGNQGELFKTGRYKIRANNKHHVIVGSVVLVMKGHGIKFAHETKIVQAISKAAWVPGFDVERLKDKIRKFPHIIEKKATVDLYLDVLEQVYNHQSRDKFPLKFMAIEEARKRNVVKK